MLCAFGKLYNLGRFPFRTQFCVVFEEENDYGTLCIIIIAVVIDINIIAVVVPA